MKKYGMLVLLGIICIPGHSCRKQQAINDVLGQYVEAGNYQLVFYEGYPPEFNIDSTGLADRGMMCNLTIDSKGKIICYYGESHEYKAAEWKILEASVDENDAGICRFTVKMLWPEKSSTTFEYGVSQHLNWYSEFYHTTHVIGQHIYSLPFIFFNNKNTSYGWPGAFHFRKK
jgi:hypothetical protein